MRQIDSVGQKDHHAMMEIDALIKSTSSLPSVTFHNTDIMNPISEIIAIANIIVL